MKPPPEGSTDRPADRLMPLVYEELKRLAGRYLRADRAAATLAPTSLVHEAYLRLAGQERAEWQDRAHFFRVAAQMMRRVLVDRYRAQHRQKRGGAPLKVTLSEVAFAGPPLDLDVLALDHALSELARFDPQQATIVELRFFAGLTVEETAEALDIGTATVKREWALARAWILRALGGAPAGDHGA
jgi:RNA polymerase sigma-70 factor, ECF subfamily